MAVFQRGTPTDFNADNGRACAGFKRTPHINASRAGTVRFTCSGRGRHGGRAAKRMDGAHARVGNTESIGVNTGFVLALNTGFVLARSFNNDSRMRVRTDSKAEVMARPVCPSFSQHSFFFASLGK